jgi:hypothetical protein
MQMASFVAEVTTKTVRAITKGCSSSTSARTEEVPLELTEF